jgi:hypothetical protein
VIHTGTERPESEEVAAGSDRHVGENRGLPVQTLERCRHVNVDSGRTGRAMDHTDLDAGVSRQGVVVLKQQKV